MQIAQETKDQDKRRQVAGAAVAGVGGGLRMPSRRPAASGLRMPQRPAGYAASAAAAAVPTARAVAVPTATANGPPLGAARAQSPLWIAVPSPRLFGEAVPGSNGSEDISQPLARMTRSRSKSHEGGGWAVAAGSMNSPAGPIPELRSEEFAVLPQFSSHG